MWGEQKQRSHLVASEQRGGAQKLRDSPEGFLFPGLGGGEVQRRDHVVVSEARVGAGPEQRLDRGDVPAEGGVVQGRPANLDDGKRRRTVKAAGRGGGYQYRGLSERGNTGLQTAKKQGHPRSKARDFYRQITHKRETLSAVRPTQKKLPRAEI